MVITRRSVEDLKRLGPRATLPRMNDEVIYSDPEILGGTPVFRGTRVPVKSLFDHLEAGD